MGSRASGDDREDIAGGWFFTICPSAISAVVDVLSVATEVAVRHQILMGSGHVVEDRAGATDNVIHDGPGPSAWTTSVAGVVAVASNVAAVVVVSGGISAAYQPDELPLWLSQSIAAPGRAAVAGALFAIGVLALPIWMRGVLRDRRIPGRQHDPKLLGALTLVCIGNALGSLLPPFADVAGADALRAALWLDALFNLGLGAVFVVVGARSRASTLGLFMLVAGVITLPVSLQGVSAMAADLLAIAGPLWLMCVLAWSVTIWREGVRET